MGELVQFFTGLHQRTSRDYLARMIDDKVYCSGKAKAYEYDYWDGDRRFGYGGYRYDGRWRAVAEAVIERYQLPSNAKILDVGCGKAHLLYELSLLLPDAELHGLDRSVHGISDAPEGIRSRLRQGRAEEPLPWPDDSFDLVLSLGCLHNLRMFELEPALAEIERVGRAAYVMMESYRNDQELFNLQCWALTCESFLEPEEWRWCFERFGYSGDYEFIYFE